MSSSTRRKRPSAMSARSSKRRSRRTLPAAAAAAEDTGADASPWASLHEDLVGLIGWRVLAGDLLDYVRFRAVCTNWRSSTACPRGRGVVDPRFHPRRWMMFPEGHGLYPGHGKLRGYVRFFNLSTGAFVRVRLPLFRDHCALTSTDGIMLLHRDHDTAVRLLNPFTGDITELPRLNTLGSPVPLEERQLETLRDVIAAAISIYRLADLILERIVPVTDIGGNCIFLAAFHGRMLSVSAKAFPAITADSIVFLHKCSHYLAQYQLSTRTLSPTSDGRLLGIIALPSPRSIFYYIFTCCYREKWNKGHMVFEASTQRWRVKGKWRSGSQICRHKWLIPHGGGVRSSSNSLLYGEER
ncbi:hypothetical protein ACP70R_015730 [Stipagrostis hirtigluma subsp. patula]